MESFRSSFFILFVLLTMVCGSCSENSPTEPGNAPIEIEMTVISAGSFKMGSNYEGNPGNNMPGHTLFNEQPVHVVNLDSFEMSTTEITQEQYAAVMGTNPSFHEGMNLPVEQVSWNDAVEFCNKLSEMHGLDPCYEEFTFNNRTSYECDFSRQGYRLPTEAEWEYACRAGTTTLYYIGDDSESIGEYAWYQENSHYTTHPVGQKEANSWGLYDMLGNVQEWCNDWYGEDYYEHSPSDNPQGPDFPGTSLDKIVRGGSFGVDASALRSAVRGFADPRMIFRSNGFRIVKQVT